MHDTTAIQSAQPGAPSTSHYVGYNANPRYAALYRHYPTIDYLRRGARRNLPHFAFNIPTAVPARTTPASGAIGRRSMRSSLFRATA